jgi:hypothetical protein
MFTLKTHWMKARLRPRRNSNIKRNVKPGRMDERIALYALPQESQQKVFGTNVRMI